MAGRTRPGGITGTPAPGYNPLYGPFQPLTIGRSRNTLLNKNSKQSPFGKLNPAMAGLTPDESRSLTEGLSQAQLTLASQLMSDRANIEGTRTTTQAAVAKARQTAITDMGTAEGNALQNGVLGSSGDYQARSAVLANRAASIQQARVAGLQNIQQYRSDMLGAYGTYYNSLANLAGQRASYESTNLLDAYSKGLINAGYNPNGPRGGRTLGAGNNPVVQLGLKAHENAGAFSQAPPGASHGGQQY